MSPGALPLPAGFRPYAWAPSSLEIAARHGLRPEHILRFDQNTPPLPGVPRVPLAQSFARLNDYPDGTYRELREAAASYCDVDASQIVVGAGADELIALCARTFLGPGRCAAISPPTYGLYRIVTELEGAEVVEDRDGAAVIWVCNPNNPTGELREPTELAALARAHAEAIVVVDEAYFEFADATCVPLIAEQPSLIVLRTLSKVFGLASLRVGYAIAAPDVAAELELRRAPASVSGPAARIAAAALREPRIDVQDTLAERARVRDALLSAGHDCPESAGNFVFVRTAEPLGEQLERQGLVVRHFAEGVRITLRRPRENDVLLAALGTEVDAVLTGREVHVARISTETALRISLDLDGAGHARVETGIGFLDHLLALWTFHGGFDLELLAGGDLEVDEHHTVEDVLAALGDAVSEALGAREGIARYGSAIVPMDEATATVAVDLVRRPHAEIALQFGSDRVGGLAVTLLAHALERFAIQAGCTIQLTAAGGDDHHVAEAAFKALGQALRQACTAAGEGVRSTKGLA
ncbi:MAG: aminotransferase class I/II-fold pyridoxal phosphate-dependent enzyme [Gaiellaceae bacterium MAG52_C11]|nr:aminotransferase class I/II-fold pyridoxal phosphate-dependent enzyme [Candidatus Gaiellasilicea maunaloa]